MHVEFFEASRGHRFWLASGLLAIVAGMLAAFAAIPATAGTLDRIRESGRIKLGYLVDQRPFSYRNEAGEPEGYGVDLCRQIAAEVKTRMPGLAVDWVPVTADRRIGEVELGSIDLLCSPMSVTLARRKDVAFSIPVFAAGNRAVMRADSAAVLRDALGETQTLRPVWRGSPAAKVLKGATFGAVTGTTTADWLEERRAAFQVDAKIVQVRRLPVRLAAIAGTQDRRAVRRRKLGPGSHGRCRAQGSRGFRPPIHARSRRARALPQR